MEYTEQQQALLQKVTALQQEKQLSQNALGKLLGISGTALSQLRNGKYQADPQRMFDILESYFGVKEQTEQTYQEVPYADTSISEVYARSKVVWQLPPEMPALEKPKPPGIMWLCTRKTAF